MKRVEKPNENQHIICNRPIEVITESRKIFKSFYLTFWENIQSLFILVLKRSNKSSSLEEKLKNV